MMKKLLNYLRSHAVKLYQTSIKDEKLYFTKKPEFKREIKRLREKHKLNDIHIASLLSLLLLHDIHQNHKRRTMFPLKRRKPGTIVFDWKNLRTALNKVIKSYSLHVAIKQKSYERKILQSIRTLHKEGILTEFEKHARLKSSLEKHTKYQVQVNKKAIKSHWTWIR